VAHPKPSPRSGEHTPDRLEDRHQNSVVNRVVGE